MIINIMIININIIIININIHINTKHILFYNIPHNTEILPAHDWGGFRYYAQGLQTHARVLHKVNLPSPSSLTPPA